MAPGTGKTLVAIRAAIGPILVICRRDDFLTWNTELKLEGVERHQMEFIQSGAHRLNQINAMSDFGVKWFFVTYDLVKNSVIYEWIKHSPFNTVIADESHMIKRWESKRTKAVIRATRHIKRRLALTGSPITNEVMDVFSQALFIDNGQTFGNSQWYFKQRYYLQSGPGWYPRKKAKDEIASKLPAISFHVHEDDVLTLPPIRRYRKSAPMHRTQRIHYEEILTEFETVLNGGSIIEVDYIVTQVAKLRQVASGFLYDENHDTHEFPCPKLDVLFDLLENPYYLGIKPKIVIWCSFTAEIVRIARIAQNRGISTVQFMGSKRREKENARIRFRDDPTVRLFIGQVDSGVGMNELVVADSAVYYSNSHKVVSRQQSMRRTRRIGSERHKAITYVDLITEGSVDEKVLECIGNKMSIATFILDQLKNGHRIREILK